MNRKIPYFRGKSDKKLIAMKKIFLPVFILLMLGVGTQVQAQDFKITTGVVDYNNQDFADAIEALTEGLSDVSQLKEKNVPKGFYYRGLARKMYMRQLGGKVAQGGSLSEDEESAMETIVIDAYTDFQNAKKYDDGKWTKKIDVEMQQMNVMILQAGLGILNGTFGGDLSDAEKKEAYSETIKYMDLVTEGQPDNYMGYDLRAQAELALGDSASALKDFNMAAQKFDANPPQRPDMLASYTYYRKALIERYFSKDIDAALASLDKGKQTLAREWERIQKNKEKYTPQQWGAVQKQHDGAREDLSKFELDLLLNSPGKLQQAIGKFETAVEEEPDNYILHVAFAQLLEKVDMVKAEEMYKIAAQVDPSKSIAWFNLGALYVNQGVAKYTEANEIEDDFESAKALQAQGDKLYEKALGPLEKAFEIDKCDRNTLNALKNIAINLSAKDEEGYEEKFTALYKKYTDAEKACK